MKKALLILITTASMCSAKADLVECDLPRLGTVLLPWMREEALLKVNDSDEISRDEFGGIKITLGTSPLDSSTVVFVSDLGRIVVASRDSNNKCHLDAFRISEELVQRLIKELSRTGVMALNDEYVAQDFADGFGLRIEVILDGEVEAVWCDNYFPSEVRVFLNFLAGWIVEAVPPPGKDDTMPDPKIKELSRKKIEFEGFPSLYTMKLEDFSFEKVEGIAGKVTKRQPQAESGKNGD
jgi:hypothetical protein